MDRRPHGERMSCIVCPAPILSVCKHFVTILQLSHRNSANNKMKTAVVLCLALALLATAAFGKMQTYYLLQLLSDLAKTPLAQLWAGADWKLRSVHVQASLPQAHPQLEPTAQQVHHHHHLMSH
jgi:hypothetical protein